MPKRWTEEEARLFWANRPRSSIIMYDDLNARVTHYQAEVERRSERIAEEKRSFLQSRTFTQVARNPLQEQGTAAIADNLSFWIKYSSWTYCEQCGTVSRKKLTSNFKGRAVNKKAQSCPCRKDKYVVPKKASIPEPLRNLTPEDVRLLRPFVIHAGDYERRQSGYRVKRGIFKVTPDAKSVSEKINDAPTSEAMDRCRAAYDFLISSDDSSYKHFVALRDDIVTNGQVFNSYDMASTRGIECALWPSLYPFTDWCESVLSGRDDRTSTKRSFVTKVQSQVVDYSLDFELLLFHYDRWVFKTVTGAITSARRFKCSPARSLDDKCFSPEYWKWQHRYLLDALRQYGLPTVFVTLSPFEWSFPFPSWLNDIRADTGRDATQLAGLETIHIAHVLEQIVRGYLCGSNDARWSQHLFSYNADKKNKNVLTYFYRFEFQGRGTVHLHLLVWLKGLAHIQHQHVRADIPSDDPELAYLVHKLQPSNKASPFLTSRDDPSCVETVAGETLLRLKHPAEAFALNLRAYIATVVPVLKCAMDFQVTDGNGMVLRYVSSYVSKTHDALSTRGLYSTYVSPVQAAYRHISEMAPCEPEMWMSMCDVKMSWSCSRTKRYTPPISDSAEEDKVANDYRRRPKTMEELSFLSWLRLVNHRAKPAKAYKSGATLVGLKYLSYQNPEYFFQYVLMNVPHRSLCELYHKDHETLPTSVRFFASALSLKAEVWGDLNAVREMLENEGNRRTFVETTLAHVESLHDVLTVCALGMLSVTEVSAGASSPYGRFSLDAVQNSVVNAVLRAQEGRDELYETDFNRVNVQSDSEHSDSEHSECEGQGEGEMLRQQCESSQSSQSCDWTRPILVTGGPGTGKTHTVLAAVEQCLKDDRQVLLTAPTGFLASKYREIFGDESDTETVHAAFKYPVLESERARINWLLSQYELVVIDEISMITVPIFHHVLKTLRELPRRPILLLSGDVAQQQPIVTVEGRTSSTSSILSDQDFIQMVLRFKLVAQYRCVDESLRRILDHIRCWIPTDEVLRDLQCGRLLTSSENPSDQEIITVVTAHPQHTFLTVSRNAANRVNSLVLTQCFTSVKPLGVVQYDCDLDPLPVYQNMRVMITQNRDKERGIVNGQMATVELVRNRTILLKLPNNEIVNIYLVTYTTPSGEVKTTYPFMPGYALTICKAQGQTLSGAILWFDVNCVPIATGYVGISRVKKLEHLLFLTPLKKCHFRPNRLGDLAELF